MTSKKDARPSQSEHLQMLDRFAEAIAVIQRYAPRITGTGLRLLVFIARESSDRKTLHVPRLRDMSRYLDLSSSGASRLLETLTVEGRKDTPRTEGGYGLVETDDFIEGRRTDAYVLTAKGKKCVEEVLSARAGKPCSGFDPHDLGSLFKLMMAEWERRPD